MKITFYFFALSLVAVSAIAQTPNDWSKVYSDVKPSIPVIFSSGGLCSGALITDRQILTAAHCVWHLRDINVMWIENPGKYEPATTIALDKENDIAVIELTKPTPRKPIKILPEAETLKEGQPLATIGHPITPEPFSNPPLEINSTHLISAGVVSKVTDRDLITDVSVSPGNSGGPAFDLQGRIIGVVSRKRVDRWVGMIGYTTNHKKIHDLLKTLPTKSPGAEVSWLRAAPSTSIYIGAFYNSELGTLQAARTLVYPLGINMNLLDRLHLNYQVSTWDAMAYQSYGFGWKFDLTLANQTQLWIIPSFDWIEYKVGTANGNVDVTCPGYSLALRFTTIPIGLKVTVLNLQGHTEFSYGLQLYAL